MTPAWTLYDRATGRIVMTMTGDRKAVKQLRGFGVVKGEYDPALYWIDRGMVRLRAPLDVVVSGRMVAGLPRGTRIIPRGHGPIEVEGDSWEAPADLGPEVIVTVDAVAHFPTPLRLRDYRADRIDAYPAIGDQLDALAKGFAALRRHGVPLPDETADWLDDIARVKQVHPKE